MSTQHAIASGIEPRWTQQQEDKVRSLLLLHESVQRINSILELEPLLDHIVKVVTSTFGCVEAGILLVDGKDELVMAAVHGCRTSHKGDRYKIGRDGLVGYVAATGQTVYVPDVRLDPRYIACEPETMSEIDIPLKFEGKLIGIFNVSHCEVDGFPLGQREILESLAGHIAVAIENARRFQREREGRAQLYSQQQEARTIQQALLPASTPQIEGFAVDAAWVPAEVVAGDWYDWFRLCDGRWGFVLADVAGKGMPAALLMSATRAVMRSFASVDSSPAATLRRINERLLEDLPPAKFVTMVYAVLDPRTRTLTFANAGHPWPVFANGTARFLQTSSGLPLGIADCDFDEHTVVMPEGSRLLLYSDGIIEARNYEGDEYGLERLSTEAFHDALKADHVIEDVRAFVGPGCCFEDDATVIVLRSE